MRAKKMRQDGGAEFISASLNTCGLLKRASLERKKYAGGESNAFPVCSTRVRFGTSQHISLIKPPLPQRGRGTAQAVVGALRPLNRLDRHLIHGRDVDLAEECDGVAVRQPRHIVHHALLAPPLFRTLDKLAREGVEIDGEVIHQRT